MALRGCINIDRLPLQILLKDNPAWKGTPVAVTKEEKPQSPILALNREAREKGLAAGMRYASALSFVPSLRARAVSSERVAEARDRIVRLLSAFTPDIEPCPFDTDAFWVSVDGLRSLFDVRVPLDREGARRACGGGIRGKRRGRVHPIRYLCNCPLETVLHGVRIPSGGMRAHEPVFHRYSSTSPENKKHSAQAGDPHRGAVRLPPAGETIRRLGKEAGLLRQAILSDDPCPSSRSR